MNQQTAYQICILGFGIAGQLCLLECLQRGIKGSDICVLDSNFCGGALVTQYPIVISNTPWEKTKRALQVYSKWSDEVIRAGDAKYTESQCMPVGEIGQACLETAQRAGNDAKVRWICTHVESAEKNLNGWTLHHSFGSIQCKTLLVAQGGIEKRLDIDLPTIPLSVALNKDLLSKVVKPNESIAVFGLAHSGTICLKYLHELGIPTYGIYNTKTPFIFKRDGAYDGIKEGSEAIADACLRGEFPKCTLVSWSEPLQLFRVLQQCTKVIQCVGLKRCPIQGIPSSYDEQTAKIDDRLYGFGLAYPGITTIDSKRYADVSVLSFQEQIQRCLPKILEGQ